MSVRSDNLRIIEAVMAVRHCPLIQGTVLGRPYGQILPDRLLNELFAAYDNWLFNQKSKNEV